MYASVNSKYIDLPFNIGITFRLVKIDGAFFFFRQLRYSIENSKLWFSMNNLIGRLENRGM